MPHPFMDAVVKLFANARFEHKVAHEHEKRNNAERVVNKRFVGNAAQKAECGVDAGKCGKTANTYKNAKDKSYGRYVAVNLCNYSTVEFRLFRGTLNYNTFLATLQLVDELCHVCKDRSDTEIEGLSWSEFVGNIKDKDELIKYLKSKRLYINEITEESEEI
jgi:hypothetical protein